MDDVFSPMGASIAKIDALANWVRKFANTASNGEFDIIRFIEIDLPRVIDGFYVEIERDDVLGNRRAYIDEDEPILVVSESIYNGAANKCYFSIGIILHEIGHLFMHSKYLMRGLNSGAGKYQPTMLKMKTYESAEWQANIFALSFLYPCEKYGSVKDENALSKQLPITKKQAALAINHMRKVQVKKNNASAFDVNKWVANVNNCNYLIKKDDKKITMNEQLRLFG